jgi:purine-binding chemotaxis protein CheW
MTESSNTTSTAGDGGRQDLVTFYIDEQLFGIPVLAVRDVLLPQAITRVRQASPEVAGLLNLRGRIVTVLDIRHRLGISPDRDSSHAMSIVVDHAGELYSLMVDRIGDVLSHGAADVEANPPTINPRWREVSAGVCRLESGLLVVLDIGRLLRLALQGKIS